MLFGSAPGMSGSLCVRVRCLRGSDHAKVDEKTPCVFGSPTCVFYLEPSGSAAQLLEVDAKLRAAFSYQRFRPRMSGGGGWVATPTAGQRGGLAVKQGPCPRSQQPKSDPHTGLLTSGQLCGWQCKRLLSAILQSYIFDCQGGAHGSVCARDLSR